MSCVFRHPNPWHRLILSLCQECLSCYPILRRRACAAYWPHCLSMLLSSLGISIANVGLPALATAFHASFQAVQWVLLCYLLAVTTCIIGIGRLGDSLNRRRLLLAGIALFTAASLACALAPQLWLLLAARLAQGLGARS